LSRPESVVEWFTDFYKLIKDSPVAPVECVLKPGELLFIPSRWWHTALNLEESIAVTQNVVSTQNLYFVANFLKSKKKQELFNAFSQSLEAHRPGLLDKVEKEGTNYVAIHSNSVQRQHKRGLEHQRGSSC
jgi:ribosomal protein L16 Arg81 hydroxylase